jgi:hypothetical protein
MNPDTRGAVSLLLLMGILVCSVAGSAWAYEATQKPYPPAIYQTFSWNVPSSGGPYFRYNFSEVFDSNSAINVQKWVDDIGSTYHLGFINSSALQGLNETIVGREVIINGSLPVSLTYLGSVAQLIAGQYGISLQQTNSTLAIVTVEVA